MDLITGTVTAAIAAIGAGAAKGVGELGKQAVVDLYSNLKDRLESKFGEQNTASQAIAELERDYESKGRQMVLAEQVALRRADQDPKILDLATKLREALEATDTGKQAIAKYMIDAKDAQIGVMGDGAHVEGGIHFGDPKK